MQVHAPEIQTPFGASWVSENTTNKATYICKIDNAGVFIFIIYMGPFAGKIDQNVTSKLAGA
jgi:hypothetical protein